MVAKNKSGFREDDPGLGRQLNFLSAKEEFARAQNQIDDAPTDQDAEEAVAQSQHASIHAMQFRREKRANESDDDTPKGDLIRNNEMLDIDKCRDNQPAEEDEIEEDE